MTRRKRRRSKEVFGENVPESMAEELAAWNYGRGVSLFDWIRMEGNFRFAVGYASVLWPKFIQFEGYIFREGFSV